MSFHSINFLELSPTEYSLIIVGRGFQRPWVSYQDDEVIEDLFSSSYECSPSIDQPSLKVVSFRWHNNVNCSLLKHPVHVCHTEMHCNMMWSTVSSSCRQVYHAVMSSRFHVTLQSDV